MNRPLNRGIRISREKIEKDIEKLKKRLNKIYQEILARQDALTYMTSLTQAEAATVVVKEAALRAEIEKTQVRADDRPLEQATQELENENV